LGVYNYTLDILETGGVDKEHRIDTIFVTVNQLMPPIFNDPVTIYEYELNSVNNELSWNVTEYSPKNYTIFKNGSIEVFESNWLNLNNITINIDGLPAGNYNYTIQVFDIFNQSAMNTISVTVGTMPIFEVKPDNTTYSETSTGNTLSWIVSDASPHNYTIFKNGSVEKSGTWLSYEQITINIDGLLKGIYNYSILVQDIHNNLNSDTLIVEVIDDTLPLIQRPSDLEVPINSMENIISWTGHDLHPDIYFVYRNGSIIIPGNIWVSGIPINLNVDSQTVGVYNYTIVVFDESGNSIADNVFISVIAIFTIPPSLDIVSTVYEGHVDRIFGYWESEDTLRIVEASIIANLFQGDKLILTSFAQSDNNGEYSLDLEYNDLPNGSYNWIIEFFKVGYESQIFSANILVLPHSPQIEITIPDSGSRGDVYMVTIDITYNNTYSTPISLNEITSYRTGPVVGVYVALVFDIIYENGQIDKLYKNGTTDNNGQVILGLEEYETKVIAQITNIYFQAFEFPSSFKFTMQSLQQINEINELENSVNLIRKPTRNGFQSILTIFYSLFFLIVSFFTGYGFWYYIRRQSTKFERENQDAFREMQNLGSIRGVFLYSLENQSPFFSEKFGIYKTDPTLIAGLMSAISTFLDELDDQKGKGFQTMNRTGLSITSHKSDLSALTIISKKTLDQNYLFRFKKAQKLIDNQYESEIQSRVITLNDFDANVIAEIFEDSGLKFHLLRGVNLDNKKLDGILRSIAIYEKKTLLRKLNIEEKSPILKNIILKSQIRKLNIVLTNPQALLLRNLLKLPDQLSLELRIDTLIKYLEDDKGLTQVEAARLVELAYEMKILIPNKSVFSDL
ncbi:MAG: hypothetical protein ACW99Q_12770, partial [Candidatus Kariarchaeaceae archaeon]